jgi:transglutaminase-like putative cysteine protease
VCQDHAHVMIAVARTLGIPARYVSGYLSRASCGSGRRAAHRWTCTCRAWGGLR